MTTIECVEAIGTYPISIFAVGVICWFILIKYRQKLTLAQAPAALIGIRRIQGDLIVIVTHFAILTIPLFLWAYLALECMDTGIDGPWTGDLTMHQSTSLMGPAVVLQ